MFYLWGPFLQSIYNTFEIEGGQKSENNTFWCQRVTDGQPSFIYKDYTRCHHHIFYSHENVHCIDLPKTICTNNA